MKGEKFLKTPFNALTRVQDFPGIGPVSAKQLEAIKITTPRQLVKPTSSKMICKLGLFLQFEDPIDFIAHLEQKDVTFPNSKIRNELLKALEGKWELMKVH